MTKYHQESSNHLEIFRKMGSSISKYEDLELSTAEGGLEPLPTSKKSKQFCKNCNNLVKMWIIYFATRFLERKKAFGPKNIWANPIKKDD